MKKIIYYLWKLKYLEGTKVSMKDFDKKNIPDNIYLSQWDGNHYKVDCDELNTKDIELFLKAENAYNLNLIKICVIICTIFFVLAVIQYIHNF